MSLGKNPWLGLLSYEDPIKTKDKYVFCGRDNAISSLFAMIDNNLLVTLYGKTGIGKTSVLNAGVFPTLRSAGYLPISIRLGKFGSTKDISFSNRIVSAIEEEVKSISGTVDTIYPEYARLNNLKTDFLWKYFCTSIFKNGEGKEIYPVIVLDQFEEIFIKYPKDAELLLMQINALIDDNRELPETKGYSDTTNFRFVFSIREDDLFYLEDVIDMNHLTDMKQNRYRLAPLSKQEASEVIMIGRECLKDGEEDEIANRIIRLAKDGGGMISTNILSLLCSQLYTQCDGNISIDNMTNESKNLLDAFYINCISHVSEHSRKYIEENLVDGDRRKFISKIDFLDKVGADADVLTEGQFKIIQDVTAGNRECVELIHDSLARTIYHIKSEVEERQKLIEKQEEEKQKLIRQQEEELARIRAKQKRRWLGAGIVFVVLVILSVFAGMFLINKTQEERQKSIEFQKMIGKFNMNISLKEDIAVKSLWWEANLKVVCNMGVKDTILLDTLINKTQVDSTYTIPVDSIGYQNLRITLSFPSQSYFKNVELSNNVEFYALNPSVSVSVMLKEPVSYGGQLVMKDEKTNSEFYLKNAIVVLNNEVDFTDEHGKFLFHLQDTVKPDDQMIIVKRDFEAQNITNLQKFRISSNKKEYQKVFLFLKDSVNYYERIHQCDSVIAMVDSVKNRLKKSPWLYHREIDINYTNSKSDEINDVISLYIVKRNKGSISGYYYYNNDRKKNKQYRFHIFNGKMGRSERDPKDSLYYRSFELTSCDIANNVEMIRGRLCMTNKNSDIKVFMNSRKIAESVIK